MLVKGATDHRHRISMLARNQAPELEPFALVLCVLARLHAACKLLCSVTNIFIDIRAIIPVPLTS